MEVTGPPPKLPAVAVRVSFNDGVPVIVAEPIVGAIGAITLVAEDVALADPPAFVTVITTFM